MQSCLRPGHRREERVPVGSATLQTPFPLQTFELPRLRSLAYLLPRLADVIQQIRSDKGLLSDLFGSEVSGESMQVNSEQDTLGKCAEILLSQNPHKHACENVSHPCC